MRLSYVFEKTKEFIYQFSVIVLITLVSVAVQAATPQGDAIIRYNTIHHPIIARDGMVVSQRVIASEVGRDILQKGGNAVDAAVATGFALAVTLPRAGNVGGGGFMLIHLAELKETIAIDYRETAPRAAHRDLFIGSDGEVDNNVARYSLKSSGVPGTVAGLTYALEHYGTMSLREVIKPAVQLAGNGFEVSWDLSENLKSRREFLSKNPATKKTFFKPDGSPYEAGDTLKQPELAKTLKLISRKGAAVFYQGEIAEKIVAEMEKGGGLITRQDLADYKVAIRKPIVGAFRGYKVVSMPPTSSGGVHVVQMLNILSHFPLASYGAGSANATHLLAETMKLAYADRSKHLGDQDFYDVPSEGLTSKSYAKALASTISMKQARPSTEILPGEPQRYESPDTTHFSVMDQFGNAVSNTYTLNFSYGSGIVIPGTGFLMNNEMDDFSAKQGSANAFGLLGGEANAIEAGKRPLSSMTPTMVFKDDIPFVVTGSPGGSRIITTVLQVLVNVLEHDMNIAEATHFPRVHHQWLPDTLLLEPGLSPDTLVELENRGQIIKNSSTQGSLQSIMFKGGLFYGSADPRRPDAGVAGLR